MKKVNLLPAFLLAVSLLLSSCRNVSPGASETNNPSPDAAVTPSVGSLNDKNNWKAVGGVKTGYVKLDDINPDAVPEIKIGSVIESLSYEVRETDDGFLCGYIPGAALSVAAEKSKNKPRIRKYDRPGNILWEKEYNCEVYSGKINNIVPCPDGSFVFSVQTYPYSMNGQMIYEKSYIVKCGRDGNILWKQDFDDYSWNMLHDLFITKKNEIIAVGQWRVMDGAQTKGEGADDIVITKLDEDGNVLQQKSFGGNDFDMLNTAEYDSDIGIIINGRTQSRDGDFAISKNLTGGPDFIASIDENLNFKWVFHAKDSENFIYDQLAVRDGYIYIPGDSVSTGTPSAGFLIKIDKDGKMVWEKGGLGNGMWAYAVSVLDNGNIVIGSGQVNQGMMLVLDKDGCVIKKLEDLKFAPRTITPNQDGGFIVTATREIKAAPQPLYISSIWFDTELTAVRYKADYSIEWRKTYDKVKDDKGEDFALPLHDGKILVEGVE